MSAQITWRIGGKYNWKGQPERLAYLGHNWSGNGYWHQFEKVDEPGIVWCEVQTADLSHFEETEQREFAFVADAAPMTEIQRWNAAVDARKAAKKRAVGSPVKQQEALTRCAAGRDGECANSQCPQLRDNEPTKSGRHCPLDNHTED